MLKNKKFHEPMKSKKERQGEGMFLAYVVSLVDMKYEF